MGMFCYQCQEAAKGTGCQIKGVCGKSDDLSNLQDLLLFVMKGISWYSLKLKSKGIIEKEADIFVMKGLFATITNANWDKPLFIERIRKGLALRDQLKNRLQQTDAAALNDAPECALWFADDQVAYETKAAFVGYLSIENEDTRSLRALIIFGLKGMAAYAEHAYNLGLEDENVYLFMHKALVATTDDSLSADDLLKLVNETGQYGVTVMAMLDKANTSRYGNPEMTKVNIGVRNNPGILVSGHDLRDLEDLLEQTVNTGVDVYTHSEMLPAHYYPFFKKYAHFAGNYGNAWWKQREEFQSFNGPVLFTTNCLVSPLPGASYYDRVYTTGEAGFEGFPHIADRINGNPKDFSNLIEHAKQCQPPVAIENGYITGGFAHAQVFALADKVVEAVKTGAIKKFLVMAGCDGRMKSREYYTGFAEALPGDTVILTAGCAKYRYNKLNLGDINGIPRILDAGQCNDSYSLAVVALKLKEIFALNDINDLPIEYNIAWYEQKAVIVLLALLYLGVRKIHLGPTLPAFLSPNVARIITEKFGVSGIETVESDIEKMVGCTV
ncbi:MAG TPA: hydroxylamine reductase [Bacteroidales bacterium]|nr:hydroxylamine reductase [Bacteroidales bacterium]